MKAEGVVVGPAVAIMFRRENIVAGRSSGRSNGTVNRVC
jgi:hypothetical protein